MPMKNMVNTYNPSYSGGRDRRIVVQAQPWKSYCEMLSNKQKLKAKGLG
jgi:hypothetical protein